MSTLSRASVTMIEMFVVCTAGSTSEFLYGKSIMICQDKQAPRGRRIDFLIVQAGTQVILRLLILPGYDGV